MVDQVRSATRAAKRAVTEALHPLPEDRASLLALHQAARRRRDAAPLQSHQRAEAAFEIERIEVRIAEIERAMNPPRV